MSARHVSLLRGINVGGNNLISMARLRALYQALGCEDVETYLQSGNVVFRRTRDPAGVGRGVERAIKRELGLEIRVLDRTHAALAAIVTADPFHGVLWASAFQICPVCSARSDSGSRRRPATGGR